MADGKKIKHVKRSKLTKAIQDQNLKPNMFFTTSIRPTANGTLQLEVCQNRTLGGRKRTLTGMINRSDDRFGSVSTLLFDWTKFMPADLLAAFPTLAKLFSIEDLENIASTYDPKGPTGTKANVIQAITKVPYIYDSSTEEELTPVIAVTEITHSQLVGGQFYAGENAQKKIENELKNGTSVMRTGSEEDADYIVDGSTGDKIYRFTRTVFAEEYPKGDWDTMIPNKMTLTAYNKATEGKQYSNPEDIKVPAIEGEEGDI